MLHPRIGIVSPREMKGRKGYKDWVLNHFCCKITFCTAQDKPVIIPELEPCYLEPKLALLASFTLYNYIECVTQGLIRAYLA